MTISRRLFMLGAGGGVFAASFSVPTARAGAQPVIVDMVGDQAGRWVGFDPIGLWVPAGTTIRWLLRSNVHSVAAYHPDNDNHALRIPQDAAPWASDVLIEPGEHFDVTLTVPGVYDYYCVPHEQAGMVGRIIVDEPTGPGALGFDERPDLAGAADWEPVPEMARKAFPAVADIMARKRIPFTRPKS